MMFLTNGIQTQQYRQKMCVDHEEDYVKNIPHLVIIDESIFVSLLTFHPSLVFSLS